MKVQRRTLCVCSVILVLLLIGGCRAGGPILDRPVGHKKGVSPPPPMPRYEGSLPTTHVVQRGDTLWRLAQFYYGEGSQWRRIKKANPGEVTGEDAVTAGTKLTIPQPD